MGRKKLSENAVDHKCPQNYDENVHHCKFDHGKDLNKSRRQEHCLKIDGHICREQSDRLRQQEAAALQITDLHTPENIRKNDKEKGIKRPHHQITFIIERKHDLIIVVHIPDMDEYPHQTDQQNNIKCKTDQSFILFQSLRFHKCHVLSSFESIT